MNKQSPAKKFLPSATVLILLGITWGIFALLFFLLFSVPAPGEELPTWYFVGITLIETGAFFLAAALCFRNWQSGQIVSGRNVWLWIAIGLSCYGVGNILFYVWGNVWGKDPSVSLGDIFYLISYIFLAGGMLQAVLPRRLNLEMKQWAMVAVIGFLGIFLAYVLNYRLGGAELESLLPVESPPEEVTPGAPEAVAPDPNGDQAAPAPVAPEIDANGAETPAEMEASEEAFPNAPAWAVQLDSRLEPFQELVGLFYVVGDCILLVVAATLLVAFWGGRFSQSWKLIAIAAFCLYIADMFFAFSVNQGSYEEGSLWEVFWTFSALFFGLGAVVEYAISTQSRRSSRRRRAG
ncbi:hypothetical protein [Leptolyngbya sp. PCC 6406]|uniref:hypothetical protein n=1 Tax=Leptolyngbya sp. PCC 6406 TaxID=1173264 RepID=UPI0002AC9A39|nr:hypothetical protein [Leptolyngbya sp. PCC 6406]